MINELDRSLPWTATDTFSKLAFGILAESGLYQEYRFLAQAADNGCDH
jgi:hypothetical protein